MSLGDGSSGFEDCELSWACGVSGASLAMRWSGAAHGEHRSCDLVTGPLPDLILTIHVVLYPMVSRINEQRYRAE
jgi:hypothetical protein